MRAFLKNTTRERKLALIAVVLAIFAAITGNPYKAPDQPGKMPEEIIIDTTMAQYIEARQLAEWIMGKKDDFYLLDLRSEKEYDDYHIPFAQKVPYDSLVPEIVAGKKRIIVYAQAETVSPRTWALLKEKNAEKIYFLKGGLNAWVKDILFPDLSAMPEQDRNLIEKRKKISLYFGGKPELKEKVKSNLEKKYLREGC